MVIPKSLAQLTLRGIAAYYALSNKGKDALHWQHLRICRPRFFLTCLIALAAVPAALAQGPAVTVDQAECIPVGKNGLVNLTARNVPPASTVRVYFRRLHQEVEDFYWVDAQPYAANRYWAVLPKAEDEVLAVKELIADLRNDRVQAETAWAQWWRTKDRSTDRDPNNDLDRNLIQERAQVGKRVERDWLRSMNDSELQSWLEGLENEPTEYYSAVHGPTGELLTRSDMKVVEVTHDCPLTLDERQASLAENLTVGETAPWENGEEIFHWLCDGVVTRIGPDGLFRADRVCRVCVVAWWKKKEFLIPIIATGAVATGVILSDDPPPPVSPSEP